jgi:hypothetical protein
VTVPDDYDLVRQQVAEWWAGRCAAQQALLNVPGVECALCEVPGHVARYCPGTTAGRERAQ